MSKYFKPEASLQVTPTENLDYNTLDPVVVTKAGSLLTAKQVMSALELQY